LFDCIIRGGKLINAPSDKEFVFHDGSRTRNIAQLVEKIASLSDEQFSEFVNTTKNDFSNWIEFILLDKNLAERMRMEHSKAGTLYLMRNRISELEVQDSIVRLSKRHLELANEKTKEPVKLITNDTIQKHSALETEKERKEHRKAENIFFKIFKRRKIDNENTPIVHVENKLSELASDTAKVTEIKNEKHERQEIIHATGHKEPHHHTEAKESRHGSKVAHVKESEEQSSDTENALWIALYILLIALIVGLLVYKLFM